MVQRACIIYCHISVTPEKATSGHWRCSCLANTFLNHSSVIHKAYLVAQSTISYGWLKSSCIPCKSLCLVWLLASWCLECLLLECYRHFHQQHFQQYGLSFNPFHYSLECYHFYHCHSHCCSGHWSISNHHCGTSWWHCTMSFLRHLPMTLLFLQSCKHCFENLNFFFVCLHLA